MEMETSIQLIVCLQKNEASRNYLYISVLINLVDFEVSNVLSPGNNCMNNN